MDAKHIVIAIYFFEEVIFLLKRREERQPTKKNVIMSGGSISKFFLSKIPSKNIFLENLGFLLSITSYKFSLWRACG